MEGFEISSPSAEFTSGLDRKCPFVPGSPSHLVSQQRPNESSLKRFQHYAGRVRSWIPERDGSDTAFYCCLANLCPGTNFFPSLRRLALFERIDPPQFLTLPPLLRLELNHSYWQTSGIRPGEEYMAIVVAQIPLLQELFFYGPVPSTSISNLLNLKNLRSLELSNAELPAGALDTLASLPTLRTLELPDMGSDVPSSKGFRHLEALTITGRPWIIIIFLENVASTQLHTLTIRNSPLDLMPGTLSEWLRCFEMVKNNFKSCLRSFTVEAVGRLDGVTVLELLQPLMDLPDLEAIKIAHLVHPSIDDICTMTTSWHKLKHFTLDTLPIKPDLAIFGIHTLTFFAMHCPKLISLDLRIADDDLPPVKSFPRSSLPHNLQSLRLQAPVVRDHTHLTWLIDHVFPMLKEVKINDTFVEPLQRKTNFG